MPGRYQKSKLGDRLDRAVNILRKRDFHGLYRDVVSHFCDPQMLIPMATELPWRVRPEDASLFSSDLYGQMQYIDTLTYLPGDILTKVDRASMSVGLEARVPLLDHEFVELVWSLPQEFRSSQKEEKLLLKRVLEASVPRELFDRPKKGFGIPLDSWLRRELRDWGESLLDEKRLQEQGLLDSSYVRELWSRHLKGEEDWGYHLWDICMFQSWLEHNAE